MNPKRMRSRRMRRAKRRLRAIVLALHGAWHVVRLLLLVQPEPQYVRPEWRSSSW
jgi:hypothetical protein